MTAHLSRPNSMDMSLLKSCFKFFHRVISSPDLLFNLRSSIYKSFDISYFVKIYNFFALSSMWINGVKDKHKIVRTIYHPGKSLGKIKYYWNPSVN